jgi:hypothetical protein
MDSNPTVVTIISNLLIKPWVRWLVLTFIIILTIYSYVQEPIRFSSKKVLFGMNNRLLQFIVIVINIIAMCAAFITLQYTIPFTNALPDMWYIPLMVLAFAYVTQVFVNTVTFSNTSLKESEEKLNAPPEYLLPRKYRLFIVWALLILISILFLQNMIYAGKTIEFKTTVMHQYILNRFGGTSPENVLKFIFSWIGIISIALNLYKLYAVKYFSACEYNLPASWNF